MCRVTRELKGVAQKKVNRFCVKRSSCTKEDWSESSSCKNIGGGKKECTKCDYGVRGEKHDCIKGEPPGTVYTEYIAVCIIHS